MTRQEMSEVQRSLGRIEGKQDEILKNQERHTEIQDRHDVQINKLRNRQHWYTGGFALFASAVVYFKDSINKVIFG